MEKNYGANILDDRRIKLLNFLLQNNKIPKDGEFDLGKLISDIKPSDYKKLFSDNHEFDDVWRNIDISKSLENFLIANDIAKRHGENLELTGIRGKDLQKQGTYAKLLEDERNITNEARRVSELEIEANLMARRQYKINALIAFGTCIAALYYLLEIMNGFLGFYHYRH